MATGSGMISTCFVHEITCPCCKGKGMIFTVTNSTGTYCGFCNGAGKVIVPVRYG